MGCGASEYQPPNTGRYPTERGSRGQQQTSQRKRGDKSGRARNGLQWERQSSRPYDRQRSNDGSRGDPPDDRSQLHGGFTQIQQTQNSGGPATNMFTMPIIDQSEEARREKYANALRRFFAIQDQVQMLEKGLPELNMRAKEKYLSFLEVSESQLKTIVKDLTSRPNGSGNLSNAWSHINSPQAAFDQKQHNEITTLAHLEGARLQFQRVTEEKTCCETERTRLQDTVSRLKRLCEERDSLLHSVFEADYGSKQEFQLVKLLENLLQIQTIVMDTHYTWYSAKYFCEQACTCLDKGLKHWQRVPFEMRQSVPVEMRSQQTQIVYNLVSHARSEFLQAATYLSSIHFYLKDYPLPYCTSAEVKTLERAISNIFTDVYGADRMAMAGAVYDTTHKRAQALLVWFNEVMDEKIAPDLMRVTRHVVRSSLQLECERVRLLQARIEGTYGGGYWPTEAELKELAQLGQVRIPGLTQGTSTTESAGEADGQAGPPGWRVPLAEIARSKNIKPGESQTDPTAASENREMQTGGTGSDLNALKNEEVDDKFHDEDPNSLSTHLILEDPKELTGGERGVAPKPSRDQLFHNADKLWTKHQHDLVELEQLDAAQRSRTDRGLLEKIQARRLRLQQTEGTSNGTNASTSVSVAENRPGETLVD